MLVLGAEGAGPTTKFDGSLRGDKSWSSIYILKRMHSDIAECIEEASGLCLYMSVDVGLSPDLFLF